MKYLDRITLPVIVLLCLTSIASVFSQNEEVIKKQLSLDRNGVVMLENINGSVHIEIWNENEVYVEAIKSVERGNSQRRQEAMENTRVTIVERGGDIRIRTRLPEENSSLWKRIFGNSVDVKVEYFLKIPSWAELDIQTVNGAIDLTGGEGAYELQTVNGSIFVQDTRGRARLNTVNGSIEAEFPQKELSHDVDASTVNGRVSISLAADAGFYLRTRTVNGSLKSEFPIAVKSDWGNTEVSCQVNGGGPDVDINTVNGSIALYQN